MNIRTINKLDNNSFEVLEVLTNVKNPNGILMKHNVFTGIENNQFIETDILKGSEKTISNQDINYNYGIDPEIILARSIVKDVTVDLPAQSN